MQGMWEYQVLKGSSEGPVVAANGQSCPNTYLSWGLGHLHRYLVILSSPTWGTAK